MKKIIALLLFTGCVSMPGDVRFSESKTEGTKQLAVDAGWLWDTPVKLGLYKTSKMDKDIAVLEVYSERVIALNESLLVNIDGEKRSFKSTDSLGNLEADINNKLWSRKRYDVPIDYIRKMVSGKSVWVKVSHQNGTYIEGEFKSGMTTAKNGFVKFLNQINKLK